MFRNPEYKKFLIGSSAVIILFSLAGFFISPAAGGLLLGLGLVLQLSYLYFTGRRYKELSKLSSYLNQISAGDFFLDIRNHEEGELSVLKSEIYKLTVTLREQAVLLQRDKHYLEDSLSDISHQLKTPLTSLFVMTDLLSDPNLPPETRAEFTERIHSQLNRIQWLVTALLTLSKLDAGTIHMKKESVNVRQMLEKAVEHLLIPIELKEQTLSIEGDSSVCYTGDFNWSAEAIANIVKNCLEHTPAKGRISISFWKNQLYTCISIKDSGCGISPEDLPHIFKRFYKGKNAGNDSVGIGLAMSKKLLTEQNAVLSAKSQPEEGTEFLIKIYRVIV